MQRQAQYEQTQLHPLYLDCQFLPNHLQHVVFKIRTGHHPRHHSKIILTFSNAQVTFKELKAKVTHLHFQGKSHKSFKIQSYEGEQISLTVSLLNFKKSHGKEGTDIEQFLLVPSNEPLKEKVSQQQQQQLCVSLVMMNQNFDVFRVPFPWWSGIQVETELLNAINKLLSSELTDEDLCFLALDIQVLKGHQLCSFRFKTKKQANSLSEFIFEQKESQVFIGVSIITNKFKYVHPSALKEIEGSYISLNEKEQEHSSLPSKSCILSVELENGQAVRLEYSSVRQYTICGLLSILKVADCRKKGLMVAGQLYKSSDVISSFEATSLDQQITAKVESLKDAKVPSYELKQGFAFNSQQIQNMFFTSSYDEHTPCLSAYLTQALFPKSPTEHQEFIPELVKVHLNNLQQPSNNQQLWSQFVKAMTNQLQPQQVYKGWTYRVVNYDYHGEINQTISFSNFVVTCIDQQILEQKMQVKESKFNTTFKIKSLSGRLIPQTNGKTEEQVVFCPKSSFLITSKHQNKKHFLYELKQITKEAADHKQEALQVYKPMPRTNILVWVDDKQQEGPIIVKKLRQICDIQFMQVSSNKEYRQKLEARKEMFSNPNARVIVVSNMKRVEEGKVVENAGTMTYQITAQKLGQKAQLIFYIGYVPGTIQKLKEKGITPEFCFITKSQEELSMKIIRIYLGEEEPNQLVKQLTSSPQFGK